jgi:plastocyanin
MTEQKLNRRRTLAAAAGLFTASVAGCLGNSGATGEDGGSNEEAGEGIDVFRDGDFELPEAPNPRDFADRTGQEEVEIETIWRRDQIPEFAFDPPFVRVDEGTTIRWINRDGVFHSVTATESLENRSPTGDFNELIASEDATFEWVADTPGRQNYYCTPHAGFMYGSVEIV